MRLLCIAPCAISTGEALTALATAQRIVSQGGSCTAALLPSLAGIAAVFPGQVTDLTFDPLLNESLIANLEDEFQPDIVLLADAPNLDFSNSVAPFPDYWLATKVERSLCPWVTFDHLGYAQAAVLMPFGPPHRCLFSNQIREIPSGMSILIPCPMGPPLVDPELQGEPIRVCDVSSGVDHLRKEKARERLGFSSNSYHILHVVPRWSGYIADLLGLPYYRFLSRILVKHLEGIGKPVQLLSLNHGSLLETMETNDISIVNLPSVKSGRFEDLLAAADLLITENGISSTIGKAICLGTPVATLKNSFGPLVAVERASPSLRSVLLSMEAQCSGAIFPFVVYPIWAENDIQRLKLPKTFSRFCPYDAIEIYSDTASDAFRRLLNCSFVKDYLEPRITTYLSQVQLVQPVEDALAALVQAQ